MSVFHVSRIRMRLSAPLGVRTVLPTCADMPKAVRRIGAAQIGEICPKPHFEVNDFQLRSTSGGENPGDRAYSCLDGLNIEAQPINEAALCCEIVLHVHDDDGGLERSTSTRLGAASTLMTRLPDRGVLAVPADTA